VPTLDFESVAEAAESAADLARREILPRFRSVAVETKDDGSPVTEADKAAERVIRERLHGAFPDHAIIGEEYGAQGPPDGPCWLIDPIDGTLGFSRGIPLFTTLIALLDAGEAVFGLIDCPALGERYVGWKGGGCRRNGQPTRVSRETDLRRAIVSHGDPFCFEAFGARKVFERMAAECGLLRGYTDAFGHAMVLGGGVGAMVDLWLNPWDAAATQVLVPEAGGRCVTLHDGGGKIGLVFGSPALVERLESFF
jgi:histidinol phosphatase-like enzyme (inositol monophosphatase family)